MSNILSLHAPLGSSFISTVERPTQDYYATDPAAIDGLTQHINLPDFVWEPSCGEGHLVRAMEKLGIKVLATDLVYRGIGFTLNFFDVTSMPKDCHCIVTNPPYKESVPYTMHALSLLRTNDVLCLFLKIGAICGIYRYTEIHKHNPPKYMLPFVRRLWCAPNGNFENMTKSNSAADYAWFVWVKGWTGNPSILWIDNV